MRQMPRCAGAWNWKEHAAPGLLPLGAGWISIGPKCSESSPLTLDQDLSADPIPACLDTMYGMLFWDSRGPCCYYARISFLLRMGLWSSCRVVQWDATLQGNPGDRTFSRIFLEFAGNTRACAFGGTVRFPRTRGDASQSLLCVCVGGITPDTHRAVHRLSH